MLKRSAPDTPVPGPPDAFKSNLHICRTSKGICDVQETCTGSSATCPVDTFKPNTYVCRSSEGACDLEEKCTGSGANCPADVVKDDTTPCGPLDNRCDLPELCDGTSKTCPHPNLNLQEGYVVKCGKTHYFCGVEANASTVTENGGSLYLEECKFGR